MQSVSVIPLCCSPFAAMAIVSDEKSTAYSAKHTILGKELSKCPLHLLPNSSTPMIMPLFISGSTAIVPYQLHRNCPSSLHPRCDVSHNNLSLSLEPAAGPSNSHRLIHHPLANSQVLVYPDFDIFVFGNRIFLETGSKVPIWVSLAKGPSSKSSHGVYSSTTGEISIQLHPNI
jgi:hypothetical protein